MTYFTIVLSFKGFARLWAAEEMSVENSLYDIHKKLGFVFETKELCESAIEELIKKEGGLLRIGPKPKHGYGPGSIKRKSTKGIKRGPYNIKHRIKK